MLVYIDADLLQFLCFFVLFFCTYLLLEFVYLIAIFPVRDCLEAFVFEMTLVDLLYVRLDVKLYLLSCAVPMSPH